MFSEILLDKEVYRLVYIIVKRLILLNKKKKIIAINSVMRYWPVRARVASSDTCFIHSPYSNDHD